MPADLRRIAHEALSLTEPPYLKHYRRGRFHTWNGVAMTGSELPGPGFNFAACLTETPPLDDILPAARDFFRTPSRAGVCWSKATPGTRSRRS